LVNLIHLLNFKTPKRPKPSGFFCFFEMTEKQRQKKKNRKAKDACFGEADGVLDLASAPSKRIASKSRKAESDNEK